MNIKKLDTNIYFIEFEDRVTMCKTMLRFSEFGECPNFMGKIFTLGEYRAWYAKKNGSFSYYDDWSGFNIKSETLDVFRKGLFDPLTDLEKQLLIAIPAQLQTYSVIASYKGGVGDILDHEICHALYYVNDYYKCQIIDYLEPYSLSSLSEVYDKVRDLGYNEDCWTDEVHAYLSASSDWLDEEGVKYPKELPLKLQEIKKKFYKG